MARCSRISLIVRPSELAGRVYRRVDELECHDVS